VKDWWAAFLEAVQTEDFTCFKFVDEAMTYCRRYARVAGWHRAHQTTPLHGGPNVTLMATLTPNGLPVVVYFGEEGHNFRLGR
jgi:hypothetical protein